MTADLLLTIDDVLDDMFLYNDSDMRLGLGLDLIQDEVVVSLYKTNNRYGTTSEQPGDDLEIIHVQTETIEDIADLDAAKNRAAKRMLMEMLKPYYSLNTQTWLN